jgi:nucleoside-diphosphate-sugar epimerase
VRQPDITRARQLLDWEPQMEVREGLRMTIEHYAKVMGSPASR